MSDKSICQTPIQKTWTAQSSESNQLDELCLLITGQWWHRHEIADANTDAKRQGAAVGGEFLTAAKALEWFNSHGLAVPVEVTEPKHFSLLDRKTPKTVLEKFSSLRRAAREYSECRSAKPGSAEYSPEKSLSALKALRKAIQEMKPLITDRLDLLAMRFLNSAPGEWSDVFMKEVEAEFESASDRCHQIGARRETDLQTLDERIQLEFVPSPERLALSEKLARDLHARLRSVLDTDRQLIDRINQMVQVTPHYDVPRLPLEIGSDNPSVETRRLTYDNTSVVDWSALLLSPPLTAAEIAALLHQPAELVERTLGYFRKQHDYGFIEDDSPSVGGAKYRYKIPDVIGHLKNWHAKRLKKTGKKEESPDG